MAAGGIAAVDTDERRIALQRDRQSEFVGCFPDWIEGAMPPELAWSRKSHLHDARVPTNSTDLISGVLQTLGGNHNRTEQPLVRLQPLLHHPVIGRASKGDRQVGGVHSAE